MIHMYDHKNKDEDVQSLPIMGFSESPSVTMDGETFFFFSFLERK